MRLRLASAVLLLGLPSLPAVAGAEVFRDHPQAPEMVVLPGGAAALSRTEVTFAQWDACVAAGGCAAIADDHGWGRGDRPVINVSWNDAQAYAAWLSRLTGRRYRLPGDAEWERAARAGTSTAYWWGDDMRPGMARCRGCNPGVADYGTMPAASYPPNPFGLYDMNGNLWEWVADCAVANATPCPARLTRGGAWYYFSRQSRADASAPRPAAERSFTVGFRVACDR